MAGAAGWRSLDRARPDRALLACEDGEDGKENFLRGVTAEGETFPFAHNTLEREPTKDHPEIFGEFAGATFSPDGEWFFVSIQLPAITFAITGPWSNGAL